jgi:hypothetical protein
MIDAADALALDSSIDQGCLTVSAMLVEEMRNPFGIPE